MSIKARWTECEHIAKNLGLPKPVVFNGYRHIKEAGLLAGVKAGELEACEAALKLRWYGYDPNGLGEQLFQQPIPPSGPTPEAKINDAMAKLKVMVWAIRQVGSLDEAEKIFNKAKVILS